MNIRGNEFWSRPGMAWIIKFMFDFVNLKQIVSFLMNYMLQMQEWWLQKWIPVNNNRRGNLKMQKIRVYKLTKRDRSCTSSTITWLTPAKSFSPCKLRSVLRKRWDDKIYSSKLELHLQVYNHNQTSEQLNQ